MLRKQPLEIIKSTLAEFFLHQASGQAREATSNQLDDPPLRVGSLRHQGLTAMISKLLSRLVAPEQGLAGRPIGG